MSCCSKFYEALSSVVKFRQPGGFYEALSGVVKTWNFCKVKIKNLD